MKGKKGSHHGFKNQKKRRGIRSYPTFRIHGRGCRVEEVATVNVGGTPSRKIAQYWRGDVPWVSSGEVGNCRITKTVESITPDGLENSNAKIYPKGSVLIAMIGEGKTRGQAAILDIEACTNQNVAGLIFDANSINAEYVWRWAL